MTQIVVARDHTSLLPFLARANRPTPSPLVHVDAHCDMRGMLVDTENGRASWPFGPARFDEGSVLAEAVRRGLAREVAWIAGAEAGRREDLGTLLYPEDLARAPLIWRRRRTCPESVPLLFRIQPIGTWEGLLPGEALDIDWDFFAHPYRPAKAIQAAADDFAHRIGTEVPPWIFMCYSPSFAEPSWPLFERFVATLAGRYGCEPEWLDPPESHWDMPWWRGSRIRWTVRRPVVKLKQWLTHPAPLDRVQQE